MSEEELIKSSFIEHLEEALRKMLLAKSFQAEKLIPMAEKKPENRKHIDSLENIFFGDIDLFLKGICYAPSPHGYDPSTCNNTEIWFGSDIADKNIAPLWGESFSPVDGVDAGKVFKGRNDLKALSDLGVNLIRLYDWDARNDHIPFLDYCLSLGINVLVPVSNYNLGAFGTPPNMTESINGLICSFSNKEGTDYHPAIIGITIGSETDQQAQIPQGYVAEYTKKWVEIEHSYIVTIEKSLLAIP